MDQYSKTISRHTPLWSKFYNETVPEALSSRGNSATSHGPALWSSLWKRPPQEEVLPQPYRKCTVKPSLQALPSGGSSAVTFRTNTVKPALWEEFCRDIRFKYNETFMEVLSSDGSSAVTLWANTVNPTLELEALPSGEVLQFNLIAKPSLEGVPSGGISAMTHGANTVKPTLELEAFTSRGKFCNLTIWTNTVKPSLEAFATGGIFCNNVTDKYSKPLWKQSAQDEVLPNTFLVLFHCSRLIYFSWWSQLLCFQIQLCFVTKCID